MVKIKKHNYLNDDEILMEMYRRVYTISIPPANFDELIANCEINEYNQKVIPFMNYECDDNIMRDTIEQVLKEWKVPKWRKKTFTNTFWLGCSPKSINVKNKQTFNNIEFDGVKVVEFDNFKKIKRKLE